MEANDVISVLVAAYKDKVQRDVLEETRASLNALKRAKADSLREQTSADILRMSRLRTALDRFEAKYLPLKEKCGGNQVIEAYIADIRAEIKNLSRKKNHGKSFSPQN